MERKAEDRKRCFATIVYPESAPENWRNILSDMHVQACISPLHDRDLYEVPEKVCPDQHVKKYKKEHYHVMLYFEGKQSDQTVMTMISKFGGVGLEHIISKSAYARYLIHADNPEKAQYAATDVRCLGGADYYKWSGLDSDPMMFIGDIMDFIDKHDVVSFYNLAKYARKYRPEWHKVLATRNTIFFKEYLKSRNWEGSLKNLSDAMIDDWNKSENE